MKNKDTILSAEEEKNYLIEKLSSAAPRTKEDNELLGNMFLRMGFA